MRGGLLDKLSEQLANSAVSLSEQRAATARELHDKFCQDKSAIQMSYEPLDLPSRSGGRRRPASHRSRDGRRARALQGEGLSVGLYRDQLRHFDDVGDRVQLRDGTVW